MILEKKISNHIILSCCAANGDGPESRKSPGVLYGDGRYYKKDRTDKVSYVGNSKKSGKAADKPNLLAKHDFERTYHYRIRLTLLHTNRDRRSLQCMEGRRSWAESSCWSSS
jgi:hypothetical protein